MTPVDKTVRATVMLRAPLSERAGSRRISVDGRNVGEAIASLERDCPELSGWILDEQGALRTHVKAFVNGEQAELDTGLGAGDVIHVLHAISGGACG